MSLRYTPALGKPLTPMETVVMVRVIDKGETLLEVAKSISRSPSTIATHLYRVRCKLGARTQEQAAVFFDRARAVLNSAAKPPRIRRIIQDGICAK